MWRLSVYSIAHRTSLIADWAYNRKDREIATNFTLSDDKVVIVENDDAGIKFVLLNQHDHLKKFVEFMPNMLSSSTGKIQWMRGFGGAKLFFVEPGRRWAYSLSPSKAPGVSYQGTVIWCFFLFHQAPGGFLVRFTAVFLCDCCPRVLTSVPVHDSPLWAPRVPGPPSACWAAVVFFLFPQALPASSKELSFAEGLSRGAPLPNVPSFTPVHHQKSDEATDVEGCLV